MTTFAVYNAGTGAIVSTGTVLADPLPAGLTSTALDATGAANLAAGGTWNTGTHTFDAPTPAPPTPEEVIATALAALATALSQAQTLEEARSAGTAAITALGG